MKSLTENIITDLLKKHPASFRIFFWGLCKNAGKTTALLHTYATLKTLTSRPIIILTCGYDGEPMDAITGLTKPQVTIQENDYCITTDKFVSVDTFQILYSENRNTIQGNPVIAKAKQATQTTIATVGINADMQRMMQNETIPNNAVYLVDGAINRKAFLELASKDDYISISTGNSFSDDVDFMRNEVLFIEELFSLPSNTNTKPDCVLLDTTIAAALHNTTVVLKNINHAFLSRKEYELFKHNGNHIVLMKQLPKLLWITFNPFNANKNKTGQDYTSMLNNTIKTIPVINLKNECFAC